MSANQWIPTEWTHVDDLTAHNSGFTIRRMTSPFYKGEKFAVMDGDSVCLTKKGDRIYQPMPSSRTAAFYKRCRFETFDEAVAAVEKYVAKNGTVRR